MQRSQNRQTRDIDETLKYSTIVHLQSEHTEKCQFEPFSKYDRIHDFDINHGYVITCRKLRWICYKNFNNITRQVETQGNSTFFVA